MAFKMSEGSLFAVLLRSPWWYSALIGLALITIGYLLVSDRYVIFLLAAAFPFFVIAGMAVFKQSKRPSQKRIQEVAELARGMSSIQVADKIAETYTELRFDAEKFKGNAADLELIRGNRKLLLHSKRFKAANTGIEHLKTLVAAGEKSEATGYLYVALGEISDSARAYATENDIELVRAYRLAEYFDGQAEIG